MKKIPKAPTEKAVKPTFEVLPPLLSYLHVMFICSCSEPTAYEIMKEPHRMVWHRGKMIRLHRDSFLEQLKNESKPVKSA